MACITAPVASIVGGAISAGGSLLGGLNASSAAQQAASIQSASADKALALQKQQFDKVQANLAPFITTGTGAISSLEPLIGTGSGANPLTAPLTSPFAPTPERLAQTPGYQFSLDQGLKAVTSQFSANGLGGSGALGKGLVNYAEGLAGTTFQNQFNNYWTQNQAIFNMLKGVLTTGENAAAGAGELAQAGTNSMVNTLTSQGAANAAGVVGSANALNQGFSGVSSAASNTGLLLALQKGGLFGTQSTPANDLSSGPTVFTQDFGGGGDRVQ